MYADNQMAGVEVGFTPKTYTFNKWWRSRTRRLTFKVPEVPSGLYYAQLAAPDGRVGYAVFVVRPTQLGATRRVLVVLPTDTWQAYNFQDVNGDGYGDTWYAGPPNQTVDTGRPYIAAARRRASTATTSRSCTGSTGRGRQPSSSRTPTSG